MWPDTFQSIKEMLTKGNAKRINKNFVFVSEMSGMSEGHFYKVLKSEKPDKFLVSGFGVTKALLLLAPK